VFHVKNGLFFERQDDGGVRVIVTGDGLAIARDGGNVVFDQVMDASAWCSVIASMSAQGEDQGGFDRAKAFHEETKP